MLVAMRTIDSLTNNAFIEEREGHARPIEQREFLICYLLRTNPRFLIVNGRVFSCFQANE